MATIPRIVMGNGIESLREYVPSDSRVHYIITNGGAAPNVVPDTAELYLYARNPSSLVLGGIWDRIPKIGQGAALMTETTLDVKEVGGDSNVLPNARCQRSRRFDERWRRQLECPDDWISYRECLVSPTLASGCQRRHEHRAKGMIVAAKALAATGADLFLDRQLVLDAKAAFRRQMEGKTPEFEKVMERCAVIQE